MFVCTVCMYVLYVCMYVCRQPCSVTDSGAVSSEGMGGEGKEVSQKVSATVLLK